MAKTRAPLLSMEAMGSLSSVLTMSRGHRQSYTKFLRKPKDPRSQAQLGRRAWFKGLANAWPLLPAADQETWSNVPRQNYLSNYNAYLQYNLNRVDRGLTPSSHYPYDNIGAVGVPLDLVPTGGVRHVQVTTQLSDVRAAWLTVVHSEEFGPFAPTLANTLFVHVQQDLLPYTFMDAPREPGAYYYRQRTISTGGKEYLDSNYWWATVT